MTVGFTDERGGSGGDVGPTEGCENVTVEMKVDGHGHETSWELSRSGSDGGIVMSSVREIASGDEARRTACLSPGAYVLAVSDDGGDGICCARGQGGYRAYVGDARVVGGGAFGSGESHVIRVGYRPAMSARDGEWLDAHNRRRREWHGDHGVAYVPLRWSETLADEARVWAERLVEDCGTQPWHEPGIDEGENVAGNVGSGSWGKRPAPEKVCNRFVERERELPWPRNSHLTQALWRPTQYVGCGEAGRDLGDGRSCHRQVCRYIKAGNCAMGDGREWLKKVMQDDSQCGGGQCPAEGCYAYYAHSSVDNSLRPGFGLLIIACSILMLQLQWR